MSEDTAIPRSRLALALDVPDRSAALARVDRFGNDFGIMKIGLELFVAAGPDLVREIVQRGCRVFLDLKLHDIPNTVERAARRAGAFGVSFLTLHTAGGPEMLAAGVRGLAEGAAEAPSARDVEVPACDHVPSSRAGTAATPAALGVTVLTSDARAAPEMLSARAAAAQQAGCGGLVCAASDLTVVTQAAPGLLRVVPGIRPQGAPADDQRRSATPTEAIRAGADVLVIGRAVTAAPDPSQAVAALIAETAEALAVPGNP